MTSDHAPLGGVAFRCEPWELFNSAADIWALATQEEPELARRLEATAEWYEGMARTMQDIRTLDRGLPDDGWLERAKRYC
jgi:hypothetical protein